MTYGVTKLRAFAVLVAFLLLALLPSCIIIDDWDNGHGVITYAITWYNNCNRDVDVYIGGQRVFWIDGSSWLYAWQELSSETSFEAGTYGAQVYDHWNGALVSQGTIYIGSGNQEFVTFY